MADWSFARFTLTAPKSRQRVRLGVTLTTTVRRNPWNLEDRFGGYTMCHVAGGDIYVAHTSHAVPPYAYQVAVVEGGLCSEPRIAMDPRGWLHLIYTHAGDVHKRVSWDEGQTFSEGEMAFSGASHPTIAVGIDGTVIRAAYQGGKIIANVQAPGDAAPGSDFFFQDDASADLLVEDDTFHIQEAREGPGRLVLHVTIDGESATSDWWSADSGRSWVRI